MSCNRRANRRKRNSRSKPRTVQNVQKASGVIGHRVKHVDGEKFAIVSVDPAKNRSEWMMADYFGNLLIEPQTLEHQAAFFKLAMAQIHEARGLGRNRLLTASPSPNRNGTAVGRFCWGPEVGSRRFGPSRGIARGEVECPSTGRAEWSHRSSNA